MMTSLCPDASAQQLAAGRPTTVNAIDAEGTLLTTAGKRLRLLLALGLLAHSIGGLMHHAHRGGKAHGHGGRGGHWANATEGDEPPSVTVPCSVDLPELLEAAGVTGIDASMIRREEHGCCGDDICALGEDSDSCAADCDEGTTGQLVWRVEEHRHHDDDRHDDDHETGVEAEQEEDPPPSDAEEEEEEEEERQDDDDHAHEDDDGNGRRGKGGKRGEGRRGSSVGKLIAHAFMGVLGLGLLLSIRHSFGAVLRDFYTFLFPTCGGSRSRSRSCRDTGTPQVNAIAVAPPLSDEGNGKSEADVITTV
jgi:hypothetical protein